ncbi:prolyl oligopeptidase family serine peptidase [Roseateles sp. BYS180W]|uniref:Prolyl oligopeptidase family serine peptidase n=1 Tax=Roseateles rivi TaxID=3299028 RepID=A0ABW7FTP7_9BURK
MTLKLRPLALALTQAACLCLPLAVQAQDTTTPAASALAYQQPSPALRAVLDAPVLPSYVVAPDQRHVAVLHSQRLRSVAELARPVLKLGGIRFDPATASPQLLPVIESLALQPVEGGVARPVALPAGGQWHQLRFSPDGQRFLLNRRTSEAVELWVGDVASGALRQVPGLALHTLLEQDVVWSGPSSLVLLARPVNPGVAPTLGTPSGPVVQESMGQRAPELTLQDLISNAQEEALFAHHARSQLVRVQLDSLQVQPLGEPQMWASISALGRDGLLLTERLLQPFSYRVRWNDFARQVEIRNAQGALVRSIAQVRQREGVPVEGVVPGPRHFWASSAADAALYWVEARDGGDPEQHATFRDRLMVLHPPYSGAAQELHRTAHRLTQFLPIEGGQQALVQSYERKRLRQTTELLNLQSGKARTLFERSTRDRYGDPGLPLMRQQPNGSLALRQDGGALWLVGAGASPEGERPFLDRLDLASRQSTRVFQSGQGEGGEFYERPLQPLDASASRVLSLRESFSQPPQLTLRQGPQLAQLQALHAPADPAPQLRSIRRQLVKFKREDGVELSFWLYQRADQLPGQRRPALVWAYPLEFTDAATAGQVSGAPNRFFSLTGSSPLMLVLEGYVVLWDATMPVVGEPKTVNDSFIQQITQNAQAIIREADRLGVADPQRMVVAGHSYGAFMTANLLAHTQLFKAGIARSGAYNRSLTPFGFQSERRNYWEAQSVYQQLSPFNYANQLKTPLLLIHGEADANPGTYPLQSQRLYQALAGLGGQVRYVGLPLEGHGYSARESVGHVLWEMNEWMRRHVGPAVAPAPAPAGAN